MVWGGTRAHVELVGSHRPCPDPSPLRRTSANSSNSSVLTGASLTSYFFTSLPESS